MESILVLFLLVSVLSLICASAHYLRKTVELLEKLSKEGYTPAITSAKKTTLGTSLKIGEPTGTIIVDPDSPEYQIAMAKRKHAEQIARLNPK